MINNNDRIYFERTVISSLLKSETIFMDILNMGVDREAFRIAENRLLFAAAMEYYFEQGRIPTVSALYEYLLATRADASLREHLKTQIQTGQSSTKAEEYVKLIIEDNIEKEVREEISKTAGSGLDYAVHVSEIASRVISKHTSKFTGTISNRQAAEKVIGNIEKAMKGEQTEYIPTGFKSLDKYIIGIPKKHLTIIASRPGMGKTQFMLALMRNFRKQRIKTGIFSLEMDTESLWHRNLAAETGIDSIKIESGNLTPDEFAKVKHSAGSLASDDYVIDDNGHQTPESIKAKINLWKANNKIGAVLIDYLTLIDHNYSNKERNDLAIGKLTADLRIFAKESGIPIIILSQLNRAVESRTDKKPVLSDLRESGSIEQDAKLVMFLHRPSYYGIDPFKNNSSGLMTQDGFMLQASEYAEVIIRKARSGKVGTVPFRCVQHLHRFEEVKLCYGADNGNTDSVPMEIENETI